MMMWTMYASNKEPRTDSHMQKVVSTFCPNRYDYRIGNNTSRYEQKEIEFFGNGSAGVKR